MVEKVNLHQQFCQHWRAEIKVKVKGYCKRPSVAQRVPGGLGSQISMAFGT